MELLKLDNRPEAYVWKDIKIFFRTNVTVGDKYEVDTAGDVFEGNQIKVKPWEFYKTMIRLFVTGWSGVTENGKDVPYSYEVLMNRLPAEMTSDLVMRLGLEIGKKNGFIKTEDKTESDLKNG